MSTEMFLRILLIMSVCTSLFTEALKKFFDGIKFNYCSNVLAGIVSIIIGLFICIGYTVYTNVSLSPAIIVSYIALIALSWVMAMVGYDKVIQSVKQMIGK